MYQGYVGRIICRERENVHISIFEEKRPKVKRLFPQKRKSEQNDSASDEI